MRRRLLVSSIPALALAVACGASDTPPPAAPAAPPPPAPTASAAPAPEAHAPAPPLPPGVEAESVDASAKPCDDFFQYACGGWIKAHPIPEDQSGWSRFHALNEENELALKAILERDQASPPKDEPYAKALGDYYSACVDEGAIEKEGAKSIAPELKRIAAVSDAASFAREVARLELQGLHPVFNVGSVQDFKDATQVIFGVEQAGLGMPDRDYYLKDDPKLVEVREKYVAHVERTFALLGEKADEAKKDAQAVLAFETQLAGPQLSRVDRRDPKKTYHRMDRDELKKLAPAFPWDAYMKELGIPDAKAINVAEPDYLTAVDKQVAGAKKEWWGQTIRPYLRWHLARGAAALLGKKWLDEDFAFKKELTGVEKDLPRWKRCVRAADNDMGEALAIPFVKQKLGAEGKELTKEMIQSIEGAMLKELESLAWMDEATRARAVAKVHKLVNKVGYPDKWRNYDALKIDKKSYAGNAMRAAEFEMHRDLNKIGKPLDRSEWQMTPPTVNAYYDKSLNEMVFPAGILQPPFFAKTQPPAVSFGAIGAVMGHELTHGFDDKGRQFDGDGNMVDWWSPSVSTEFDKRAACVADQFDGYVAVDDLHVIGKLTLGENIADLGGLKLALASAHAKAGDAPEVDRQFFFGWAQAWCGERRPEIRRVLTRTDPHSPEKWRIDGPLSNMPEFAKAFSCREGDAMVRPADKRCVVW